jgi:hypothetical protein
MHQKTRRANATTTAPSAQATHAPAQAVDTGATVLPASNTQDAEMQPTVFDQLAAITTANEGLLSTNASTTPPEHMAPQQPLDMQPPRSTHTASSNSATAGQSRHTAETPDQSRRTNWGKLKEQARKDRSKRREVLIAVNPDACFCCPRDSNENLPDNNND